MNGTAWTPEVDVQPSLRTVVGSTGTGAVPTQPQPADAPALDIELPNGFAQDEALTRIAAYVAAQLHSGLAEREIMDRLHGYQRTRGEG